MKLADKTTTATSLVQAALKKAEQFSDYNIFTSFNAEAALKKAAAIDQKIAAGQPVGRLAGVPYALKDNFLSPDGATTASSQMLEPFHSPITATSVAKLEAEGAIMIGRTNLDSFAHGSSTENSHYGPTLNATDKTRVAGGSSGGSAVAVALDIVQFATGTDTGGSIRQPASFNGVYGYKPTYGAISRYGVIAMSSSVDCVGFFAHSPSDLDLLMSITAAQDAKDLTTLPSFYQSFADSPAPTGTTTKTAQNSSSQTTAPTSPHTSHSAASSRPHPTQKTTIGIVKEIINSPALSPELKTALEAQISALQARGHQIVELSLPMLKHALAIYYILIPAEISSNLSRYDGIRYGYHADQPASLADLYATSRSAGFMPENKRRIMIGNFVLSSGFYDAYYLKAQKARTLLIQAYDQAFKQCDFLLTPVAPTPAFKLGERTSDPMSMYLGDIMTVPVNLAGLPALAFPVSRTAGQAPTSDPSSSANQTPAANSSSNPASTTNLPLGLQLIGPRRSDAALLHFAHSLTTQEAA